MKYRALRRHQEFMAKKRNQKNYNSCIGDLSFQERQELENNIEKLKKVCVMTHMDDHTSKASQKSLQERKHDITMREELMAR